MEGEVAEVVGDACQLLVASRPINVDQPIDQTIAVVLVRGIEVVADLLLDGPIELQAVSQRYLAVVADGAVVELIEPLDEPIALLLVDRVLELSQQDLFAAGVLRASLKVTDQGAQRFVGRLGQCTTAGRLVFVQRFAQQVDRAVRAGVDPAGLAMQVPILKRSAVPGPAS